MIDRVQIQLALSKTRDRRVQGVVLSYGIQNPMRSADHPAFCPTRACGRPPITAHQALLRHSLRPVLSMLPSTHHSKPIAHAPCSGSVQYIFSSPAWLRSRFLSAYAYCRHAAELKMLCIIGMWLVASAGQKPHSDKTTYRDLTVGN